MERGRYAVDVCGGDAVVEVWIHREHPPLLACRSAAIEKGAAGEGYCVDLGPVEAITVAALLVGSSVIDVWGRVANRADDARARVRRWRP